MGSCTVGDKNSGAVEDGMDSPISGLFSSNAVLTLAFFVTHIIFIISNLSLDLGRNPSHTTASTPWPSTRLIVLGCFWLFTSAAWPSQPHWYRSICQWWSRCPEELVWVLSNQFWFLSFLLFGLLVTTNKKCCYQLIIHMYHYYPMGFHKSTKSILHINHSRTARSW